MSASQQHKIIAALHTLPFIDIDAEVAKRVEFLKQSLTTAGAKALVLGQLRQVNWHKWRVIS